MQRINLPIWRDAQRLLKLTEQAVRCFPRYHKYTLGSDPRRHAMHLWRLVDRAGNRCVRVGLRRQGRANIFIAGQGYLSGGLMRRVLRLGWWPESLSNFDIKEPITP